MARGSARVWPGHWLCLGWLCRVTGHLRAQVDVGVPVALTGTWRSWEGCWRELAAGAAAACPGKPWGPPPAPGTHGAPARALLQLPCQALGRLGTPHRATPSCPTAPTLTRHAEAREPLISDTHCLASELWLLLFISVLVCLVGLEVTLERVPGSGPASTGGRAVLCCSLHSWCPAHGSA